MHETFDPILLKKAGERQGLALDAGHSVWISANAGTGKTEVLTRRMLALLLHDFTLEPRQLLALTFTKAGAAEMAARLPARLTAWAALDEVALAARVEEELGVRIQDLGSRVRELAETVRRAPPLVATIHGLAQQILSRFTLEAGLPAEFEVLEDGAQKRLLRDVQRGLLVGVEGPLAEQLAILLDELGDKGWEELTALVVNSWHKLEALVEGTGLAGVLGRLERDLGVDLSGAAARPLVPTEAEWAALERVVRVIPGHGAREVLESAEAVREAAWRGFLLTDKDTARARLFVKAELALVDEVDVLLLTDAAARAAAQVKARKVYRGFEVTRAALLWAAAVRGAYVQRKQAHGWVDYSDLLDGLERVLGASDNGLAEWVWYGLDRRFRHLVVDEAQDNNRQQDRIIQWLAKSILSGDVGEGAARTVLAVGDMKQSIFRFQGAVPELFVQLREVLSEWAEEVREVDLTHSFRSGKQVLGLVDRVFLQGDSGQVVVGEDFREWPAHQAVAAGRASRVELWQPVAKVPPAEVEPWALAEVRAAAGGHGEDIVCMRSVGAWLQERVGRVVMPSTGVPLRYDDVMLVMQRNKTAALAAGVLRGMGIPVAVGGGVLPLVVDDAVAMLRVIFNPRDNLALAQVLKGLRGWTDTQLLQLAARAGVGTRTPGDDEVVWRAFVEGADAEWLGRFEAMAWDAPLHVVQRIGIEMGVDEVVLESLLAWAEQAENLRALVERLELEELPVAGAGGREGVRILTVHGAKGLQAPLVILPDTMTALGDMSRDRLLWGDGVVLMKQAKGLSELEDSLQEAEMVRRRADSLRGLYVAMTRAMDWLVVTGFGDVKESSDTWWTRIRAGFGENEAIGDRLWAIGEVFEECAVVAKTMEVGKEVAPAWMGSMAEVALVGEVQSAAQVRGEAVHGLLQGLKVPVDAVARAEAAYVREALPWLWARGARSEMAVALGGGKVGRIDRLVERDGVWWVVDFKTGEVPDVVPEIYQEQVRAYVAALRVTWPERIFRAAIVWTATARLDEVPVA